MFAILAIIAFVLAFIFHIAGGNVAKYVIDAELIGFICLACALLWPGWWRLRP